jgi:hypothetical protein
VNRLAVVTQWFKTFAGGVGQWWAIMSGALSVPFLFLALFNIFSASFLFTVLAYAALLVLVVTQARRISELQKPPPHKLMISPGYRIKSGDPNSLIVDLSLSNVGTPPAELHNIVGEFWTDQRFILRASAEPTVHIHAKAGSTVFARYDISLPMLHDSTSIPIVQWTFRAPSEGESIPIGVRVRSSETPWQGENWKVARDGEHVRITPAAQQRFNEVL